jgi:IS6 family transposase
MSDLVDSEDIVCAGWVPVSREVIAVVVRW